MKRTLLAIALCLICALSFTGCKSANEKIASEYVKQKDLPTIIAATGVLNGEVKDFGISDFNDDATDTLYEWQVFEKYDLQWAADAYVNSMKLLSDMYDFKYDMASTFGGSFDNSDTDKRIGELKMDMIQDSIAYEDAKVKYEQLQKNKEIRALGYEFDEVVKLKIAGQTSEKKIRKIIYIMDNGEVYTCREK